MTVDTFASSDNTLTSPPTDIEEVVPSDVNDLAKLSIALCVATPGMVKVTTSSGTISDIFIAPGIQFPIRVRRVWAEGTTATGIRSLY